MSIVTQVEATGAVTLVISGTFNLSHVPDFDRALDQARRLEQPLFLDLSRVRLIDRRRGERDHPSHLSERHRCGPDYAQTVAGSVAAERRG